MNRLSTTLLILLFASLDTLSASPINDIKPLTNKILVIHIDEGYVDYADNGEPLNNDITYASPLNISAATSLNNYSISSNDDNAYNNPLSPLTINRKTKPTEFANICEGYGFLPFYGVDGCINTSLDHADEHWLYLTLPFPLQSGKQYTINIDPTVSDENTFTFVFNETTLRSDAVHVNTVGYSTNAEEKFGYVYHWMGDGGSLNLGDYDGTDFKLINTTDGSIAYTGQLQFRSSAFTTETYVDNSGETPNQNFLGTEVYQCDFSNFNTPGVYILSVDQIGASYDFKIACNALRLPFEMAMKGLYTNRSGEAQDNPFTDVTRPAPHNPVLTPGFNGKLVYTNTTICEVSTPDESVADIGLWEAGIQGPIENAWGWYQDAGDWDAYILHFKVPIQLLFTFEHFTENFNDGQLNIPSSGNGIPDILDEARWLLRFYKRLKDETESKNWTTGGVPGGRIFGDLWGGDLGPNDIVRGSWEDNDRQWVVSGEDVITSFYFAGIAAHYQWLLDRESLTDVEGIDWETEAQNAYTWAEANYNPNDPCHDFQQFDAKLYAAANLLRLTNNTNYNNGFTSAWSDSGYTTNDQLQGLQGYGPYTYGATDVALVNTSIQNDVKTIITATASFYLLDNVDERACRWGGNHYLPMLVGHGTTPIVFEGIMGYALAKTANPNLAADYERSLHLTADYFLGTNPLHKAWITGLGENSPEAIFHLDSWASGDGSPKVGLIPYGPWRQEALTNIGPYHHMWPNQWVYPVIDEWPGHERWFAQRSSPLATEFTVHQNTINAASLYGALSGDITCSEISGVANIKLSEDCIEIFPNPVDDFFTIQGLLPGYTISIIDVNGQVVKNVANEGEEVIVSTALLGNGLFFVKIVDLNDGSQCVQKIIKL